MSTEEDAIRVDVWLWAVRLMKTRSMAANACRAGHVRVRDQRVKPASVVRVGDEVRLWHDGRQRVVVARRIIRKRVGAALAEECFTDNSPPPPPREALIPIGRRDRGAGRPTKRDRRELERLRAYRPYPDADVDVDLGTDLGTDLDANPGADAD